MATAAEALEKMRDMIRAWPDTREGPHFGDVMFSVGKKPFASCGTKEGSCEIVFRLHDAHAVALLATDTRFTRYPRDKRGIVINANDVDDWTRLEGFIRESYEMSVAEGAAKKSAKSKPATKKIATTKPATKKTATKKTASATKKSAKKKAAKKKAKASRAR